jgi:hypothetical protein
MSALVKVLQEVCEESDVQPLSRKVVLQLTSLVEVNVK